MRSKIALSALIFLLLSGCAALNTERTVVGNTFVSPYNPTLSLDIAPDLDYIGKLSYVEKGGADKYDHVYTSTVEVYFFGEKDGRDRLRRCLAVRVLNHPPRSLFYWPTSPYEQVKGSRGQGVAKIQGEDYPYVVFASNPLGRYEKDRSFLKERGYILPNVVLAKYWWRCGGEKNLSAVQIEYYEMPPEGCYRPFQWSGTGLISPCQRDFYKKFLKDADESFTVLPPGTPPPEAEPEKDGGRASGPEPAGA